MAQIKRATNYINQDNPWVTIADSRLNKKTDAEMRKYFEYLRKKGASGYMGSKLCSSSKNEFHVKRGTIHFIFKYVK